MSPTSPNKKKTLFPRPNNRTQPPTSSARGALLAKGPDSSIGEAHKGSCSEDIHMEEEKVEVRVQEEEVED